MLIPQQISIKTPTPIERRSTRKAVDYDDRWMLYAYPFVWFAILLGVAVLIWTFQSFVVPFLAHN